MAIGYVYYNELGSIEQSKATAAPIPKLVTESIRNRTVDTILIPTKVLGKSESSLCT